MEGIWPGPLSWRSALLTIYWIFLASVRLERLPLLRRRFGRLFHLWWPTSIQKQLLGQHRIYMRDCISCDCVRFGELGNHYFRAAIKTLEW